MNREAHHRSHEARSTEQASQHHFGIKRSKTNKHGTSRKARETRRHRAGSEEKSEDRREGQRAHDRRYGGRQGHAKRKESR